MYVSDSSKTDGIEIQDRSGSIHLVSISKKININKLPCVIQEKPFLDFTSWCVDKHVGVGYAYNLISECHETLLFEVQAIDPWDDVDNYRHILNNGHFV